MEQKRRYAGSFQPYRKEKNPVKPNVDQERADFTRVLSAEAQQVALAIDTYPEMGALTVRDSNGTIWEITIQRSDARELRGEVELRGAK